MVPFLIVAAILLGLFAYRFRKDPRKLSNGLYLIFGIGFLIIGLLGYVDTEFAAGFVVFGPLLVILGIAVLLIANGFIMLRKERLRIANALSLLAGAGIIAAISAVLATFIVAYREQNSSIFLPALCLLLVVGYLGFVFTLVVLYALVYARLTPEPGHTGIIVLGARVPGGRIPPLLAGRLDKAAQMYRREVASGCTPLLVTSGGQGDDEPVPEARAMAEYLRGLGVPEQSLIEEDRSTSTKENLMFSRRLLAERGAESRLLIVTSSYHVLRAAVQSRDLSLPAQVCGARTAPYYVPNAFLREFVALLVEHKLLHGLMIALAIVAPVVLHLLALPPR